MNSDLSYPIGHPVLEEELSDAKRNEFINHIAILPASLRAAVLGMSNEQLDTPYRPEGWTVRQVVHHVPESHMNAYIRFKLALTEVNPTVKPYEEALWAKLPDVQATPIEVSLSLLESLHQRWVTVLKLMQPSDFGRTFQHPERGPMNLDKNLALYSWHGRHHVAHITALKSRMGWQ
jgi:uncharacterized damage-inducible protein DinB